LRDDITTLCGERIGLDIDGTISAYPDYYSALSRTVKYNGGRVVVISSRREDSRAVTKAQLDEWSIAYDSLYLFLPYDEVEHLAPTGVTDWYERYLWQKIDYASSENRTSFHDDEPKVISLFQMYRPEIRIIEAGNGGRRDEQ
jgi:hypothetical protein